MNTLLQKFTGFVSVKGLVVVKLALLAALIVFLDKTFYLGDKISQAEDVKKEETQVAPVTPDADKKTTETAPPEKERKSFLDDLLNLPEIYPDKIKKEEVSDYLALIDKKKSQINERLDMLKKREEQLVSLEKSIDDKLQRLDEERLFFTQTIQQEKNLQGERLKTLKEFFAKMEPKKAAPVFEKLDKDLVIALFKELPQKQMTLILESMDPQKSVELSEYFGRVRSAREYDLLKEMNMSLRKEFNACKGLDSH